MVLTSRVGFLFDALNYSTPQAYGQIYTPDINEVVENCRYGITNI
nr:MAG TPA: hypothetical protein [Caudoviricetes sp.]